jgi:hypothetical protein
VRRTRVSTARILALLAAAVAAAPGSAQPAGARPLPELLVHVRTEISGDTHESVRGRYLGDGNDSALVRQVSSRLTDALLRRIEAFNLTGASVAPFPDGGWSQLPSPERAYVVDTRIVIDSDLRFTVQSTVVRASDRASLRRLPVRPFTFDEFSVEASDLQGERAARAIALGRIAERIALDLQYPAYQWTIDTATRFVVRVGAFTLQSRDTGQAYLTSLVAAGLQTELAQSPTISLVDPSLSSGGEGAAPEPKYTVTGTLASVSGRLRIDAVVVKHSVGRILVSRRALVDSIDLNALSSAITRLGREVRWAMEADFQQKKKALTVVGIPAARPLSGRPARGDEAITGEIVRVFGRKLSSLTIGRDSVLGLVVRDVAVDASGAVAGDPVAWLGEADADFLVVVTYQDLGDRVRLSSDLFSYDPEYPAVQLPIHEAVIDKVGMDRALNETVLKLVDILGRRYAATSSDVGSAALRQNVDSLIQTIPMHSIVKEQQIGIRFGAVFARPDVDLFFGENAGNYLELHYSQMLPSVYAGKPGGTFGLALDLNMGLDLGEDGSLGGAAVASGLVNAKVYLTPWKNSRTPVNFAVGGGAGVVGLRYSFAPGDRHFTATESLRDTGFVLAYDLFGMLEKPFAESWAGDLTLRWVPSTSELTTFEEAAGIERKSDLVGALGGVYLMVGVKMRFNW